MFLETVRDEERGALKKSFTICLFWQLILMKSSPFVKSEREREGEEIEGLLRHTEWDEHTFLILAQQHNAIQEGKI